jgi:hypothetical protein
MSKFKVGDKVRVNPKIKISTTSGYKYNTVYIVTKVYEGSFDQTRVNTLEEKTNERNGWVEEVFIKVNNKSHLPTWF